MIVNIKQKVILSQFEKALIRLALEDDKMISFPTDTVYGLGVNGFSTKAVERLYRLKGRDECKPLILMADSLDKMLPYILEPNDSAMNMLRKSWPGAVTFILPFNTSSPLIFSKNQSPTLGLRIPNHALLLDLLSNLAFPLVTTSANKAGMSPIQYPERIEATFPEDDLPVILDEGLLNNNPSRIIQYIEGDLKVLRP